MGRKTCWSRRRVVQTGASAGLLSLAGCLSSDGNGGDGHPWEGVKVVITAGGGSWGDARMETAIDPWDNGEFSDDGNNPATYEFIPKGYGQRMTEVRTYADDPPWDLMSIESNDCKVVGEELDAFVRHKDHVPNWENVADGFKNEYHAGDVASVTGISFNQDQADIEITSWEDFMDPSLRGRVGLPSWGWQGSNFLYIMNAVQGGDLDNLDPGFEWLEQFVEEQDPVRQDSMDHALNLMENEEIYVSLLNGARSDQIENNTGGEVKTQFVVPEEGAVSSQFLYGILNNRPDANTEAAADLVNNMLRPEIAARFSEAMGFPPTIPEAVDHISDEAKERFDSLDLSPEDFEAIGNLGIDWEQAARQESEDAERWRRIVGG